MGPPEAHIAGEDWYRSAPNASVRVGGAFSGVMGIRGGLRAKVGAPAYPSPPYGIIFEQGAGGGSGRMRGWNLSE